MQAGSAALRRAVIIQTETDVADLDVSEVLEPSATRRALAVAGGVLAAAALLAAISPASARIAVARLVRPLGDDAWPRFYHVEFRSSPQRLAAGQTFEVELLNDAQHRLPDEVRMQYRYATGDDTFEVETETMRWLNGALVARKEHVNRPFAYRAEGGDDTSMDWIPLQVLEAPRLRTMQVKLYPPEYSGLPAEEGEKTIHALRGTRVELAGSATKKLKRATLHQEHGGELPLTIAADGYGVSLAADALEPFEIDKTGQYWFELEDHEGLVGGRDERWDIRAIPDLEPTVTIEQPGTNVYVTPEGEVSLKIAVKDDLAIHDIALHFSRTDRTDVGDFVVPLSQGPEAAPRHTQGGLLIGGKLGENRVVEHRWRLAELELQPGVQVTFWATAGDYRPQTGKSTPRTLTIITPAELEERLAQRQTLIFGELQRVLKMQQDARSQTKALEIQVNEVGRLGKGDVDQAQAAELNQRQVARTLTSPTEGIPAQIADFLSELHSNHVDSPGVERHMTSILEEIDRLGRQNLGKVESELTGFIKAAQARLAEAAQESKDVAKPDASMNASLAGAGTNQDQVIDSLETMLSELGRWDNYRRFAREISQLKSDQEEIARQTKELGPQTLGRDFKELGEQQQADLKKLAAQQIDLSRRLEKTQQQMGEMSRSLTETDPIAAATISDGLHQARQQNISGQMRAGSEQLEKNQLGQAAGGQAKIAEDLDELMSILSNRREQELARLVKQLREAEDELSRIRKQQAGLRKKMKDASELTDPEEKKRELQRLVRQQKQLEEQAARLARRLERLQAEQASRSTSSAAGKMAGAGQSGGGGNGEGAQDQAEAAQKDLEEAQRQLAERRRQAEEDLAREQLARLEDSLKGLHERQEKLIGETQRLENLRADAGRLTRAQLGTLGDLARQQRGLGVETSQLGEKLALAEVIHLALDGAAGQMDRAAGLLDERETGAGAQGAQEAARLRLAQLIDAFGNKKKKKKAGQQGGGGGGGGGGSQGGSDGSFVLTQLKLLKLMQEDLNGRFRTLVTEGGDNARVVRRQLSEIAEEQGKLAELTLKLSKPTENNPEDTPEKLPDVRLEDVELDLQLPVDDTKLEPAPDEVPAPEL